MSANPVSQEFSNFIEALRSPDNATRDQAEAQLDEMKEKDILNVITQFFNVLSSNISASQKSFVAVILRKVITATAWSKLEDAQKDSVQGFLLNLFQGESEPRVRHALCDIIVQVSALQEEWPALYPFLVAACSQDSDIRVEGLYLMGELCDNSESMFADHITEIVSILSNSLQSNNLPFQVQAARTSMKIMSSMEVDAIVSTFANALPAIINTVQLVVNNRDEDSLLELLQDLDTTVEQACSYLHDSLRTIVDMCLAISGENSFSISSRSIAAHIIATMAANNGGFFRKNNQYINQYLRIAATMISDIDDEEQWEQGIFGDEDELLENDNIPHVVGITMVANIADAVHAAVYKPAMQLVSECSRSNDWKIRRVCYVMISQMADGCKKQIETDLKLIVNIMMNGLNDPSPRVQYVALQCVAYVSVALEGYFQKKSGAQIIQAILTLIGKNPCLRVQAIAASCIGQFCATDLISKKIFKNTLAPLVEWLYNLCSVSQPTVQTETINAIGFVCRAAKDDFAPFFHQIIQGLLNILSSEVTADTISVHVAACNCISSLVAAMGAASNQKEAWDIMQFLMNLIEKTPYGDERLNSLLDCAAEIFQYCEQANQVSFLNIMVPYLLKMAQVDIEYSLKQVVAGPEYQNDNGIERITVGTKNMGNIQMSINTTAIETISNAVRIIHNLLIDAKQMMLPFIESIFTVIDPLTDFSFHEEVRNLCARIYPKLFEVLVNALKENKVGSDVCLNFYNKMMEKLIEQYLAEDDAHERSCIAESLRDIFNTCYESGVEDHHRYHNQIMPIPSDTLPSVLKSLVDYLVDSADALNEMYKAVDFEERDLEDARAEFEEAAGDEKLCIENLLDAVGYIIRFTGEQIAPLYEEILKPFCVKYIASPFEYIRFIGVCSMDDMMLFAPSTAAPVVPDMLNIFSQCLHCEDPALRQAVLFGMKIIIENYSQQISGNAKDICNQLLQVISSEESLEDEYHCATDNAVSALFSLLILCKQNLPPKEFSTSISLVASYLPLQEDCAEAQDVHERVVAELMKPNHGVFENRNILDQVMRALPIMLLPVYDEGDNEFEIAYNDTKKAIVSILKTLDNKQMNSIMKELEPDMRAAINVILSA